MQNGQEVVVTGYGDARYDGRRGRIVRIDHCYEDKRRFLATVVLEGGQEYCFQNQHLQPVIHGMAAYAHLTGSAMNDGATA